MTAIFAVAIVDGCTGGRAEKALGTDVLLQRFEDELEIVYADTTLTDEVRDAAIKEMMTSFYGEHSADSAGLSIFVSLITNYCTPEEANALYDSASSLVRGNDKVRAKIESLKYIDSASAGNHYKDVAGVDALTGEPLSLSSFIGGDKPVLVDFWASWCQPCRQAIREHLIDLAAGGSVTIVGVAVWEDSVDDTRSAISELGITWPVIYTGGRTGSPSIVWGVLGIPTMVLISSDGTILSRGNDFGEAMAGIYNDESH